MRRVKQLHSCLLIAAAFTCTGEAATARSARIPKQNAIFVSQNVPNTMTTGQSYNVSVTMQNTGSKAWDSSKFQLGSQGPANNSKWGLKTVPISGSIIAPG